MEYLLFLDIETTGINPQTDSILQVAAILTNPKADVEYFTKDFTIQCSESALQNMNEWCQQQHNSSGLCNLVRSSQISLAEAEGEIINELNYHLGMQDTLYLAGNSVHFDKNFIGVHMPKLSARLSHRIIDVSSIALFYKHRAPSTYQNRPKKFQNHLALADIRESIDEYKYYFKH
jgi:oligoribonuclease